MTRILVDAAKCDCFANCVVAAPHLFQIGADGKAHAVDGPVLPSNLASAEQAVRECPVAAISLDEV
jgi:ferredoxin